MRDESAEITDLSAWLDAHRDTDYVDDEGHLYVPVVQIIAHHGQAMGIINRAAQQLLSIIAEHGLDGVAYVVHDRDVLPAGSVVLGIGRADGD